MARRKRPGAVFTPDARALALLKEDTPPAVKRALRLALRGGKQQSRRCLVCGAQGTYCQVWSDRAVWQVDAPATAKTPKTPTTRLYWLCAPCHAQGDSDALRAKLKADA